MYKSLLITLEYPPDIGGVGKYYEAIARQFPEIEVFPIHLEKKPLSWLRYISRILSHLHKQDHQFIHIGQILPLGYIGLLSKMLVNKPYIVYIHGLDVFNQHISKWKQSWIRNILKEAEAIVVNSEFTKNRLCREYEVSENYVNVVYPIIDVEKIEETASILPPVEIPEDTKIILSIGRLIRRKGFDKVIQALALLKQRPPNLQANFQYWIIGDGIDKSRLQSLVLNYNLEDTVKFLGSIPAPEIYRYFKTCDVFIMPACEIDGDVEGFGIVFLEAGVFKKPVIGGKSGGVEEAVIDGVTGLLVEPLDIENIAQSLLKLLDNREFAAKLGRQGYERVKGDFNFIHAKD